MLPNLSLVIMAAGMGSRYGGLKQLDSFGKQGQTMMDYAIKDALDVGFNHLVFIIRKSFYQDFKKIIGRKYEGKVAVDYAFQELENIPDGYKFDKKREKPWGTGHAVLSAKKYVHNNFAIVNADDYYGEEAFKLLKENLVDNNDFYCNVAYPVINTLSDFGGVSRGVCLSRDGVLVKIQEVHNIKKKDDLYYSDSNLALDDASIVSMNCWGFNVDLFDYLERSFFDFCNLGNLSKLQSEFLLPEVIDRLVGSGEKKVKVLICNERWYGITYQEDRQYVCEQLKKLEQ